jgi:hypothetical protein
MHGFIARHAPGVFDPETVKILTAAFDKACEQLRSSNAPFAADDYAEAARTILARHYHQRGKGG